MRHSNFSHQWQSNYLPFIHQRAKLEKLKKISEVEHKCKHFKHNYRSAWKSPEEPYKTVRKLAIQNRTENIHYKNWQKF